MGCAGAGGCHESSSWLYSKQYHPSCALLAFTSADGPDQAILLMPSSLTSYLENNFAGWAAAEEQCFHFWPSSPGHECRMWLWCLDSGSVCHKRKEGQAGAGWHGDLGERWTKGGVWFCRHCGNHHLKLMGFTVRSLQPPGRGGMLLWYPCQTPQGKLYYFSSLNVLWTLC